MVVDDEGDDLTEEDRRALHETLSASRRFAEAGRLRKATDILDELRRRRRHDVSAMTTSQHQPACWFWCVPS